jgi:3-deoxy-D-manno-octulosonic-acid transferase
LPRPTWSELSVPLALYRLVTRLLEPVLPAILAARADMGKEDPGFLDQRLGRYPTPLAQRPRIWLHGASVGEGLSILPLADALLRAQATIDLVITTGTVTSARLLRERLKSTGLATRVSYAFVPVDAPSAVSGFLQHWRPSLAVFTEGDLWPNMLTQLHRRNISTALVSARMTARSTRGWARFPATAGELLGRFDLVLAQDDDIASRLSKLGARDDGRLNLKLSSAVPAVDAAELEHLRQGLGNRPVVLAASTHRGEEALVLQAFGRLNSVASDQPGPLLVLAPRHPERADEIESLIRASGLSVARRSRQEMPWLAQVYLADTMGEMGLWFRLACGTFLGGSLVEGPGGHNPVEPALLAQPVAAGPHVHNWTGIFSKLRDAGGLIDVGDEVDLSQVFTRMMEGRAVEVGLAAHKTLESQIDLGPVAARLLAMCHQ